MKYIDKYPKAIHNPRLLNEHVKKARHIFHNYYDNNNYENTNKVAILLFEKFLIRLTDLQVMALIANNVLVSLEKLDFEKEGSRQVIYNCLSNILIGIDWPRDTYKEGGVEACKLMWLIQSQAVKSGLKVTHHSGEEVDVSEMSLKLSLQEISVSF